MNVLSRAWTRVRAGWRQFRDLLSGEDLADAQQFRSEDIPSWLVPGGTGRTKSRGTVSRREARRRSGSSG